MKEMATWIARFFGLSETPARVGYIKAPTLEEAAEVAAKYIAVEMDHVEISRVILNHDLGIEPGDIHWLEGPF